MTTELMSYVGMANEDRLELVQDGELVAASAITGAVFSFGSYCVQTGVDTDQIYFLDADNQVVCLRLGLIDGVVAGKYKNGQLSLIEGGNEEYPLAWAPIEVQMVDWSVCEV